MRQPRPFRRLLPAERKLWDAFPTRSPVDLRSGNPERDDPANSAQWGRGRIVRAPVITALLLGAQEPKPGYVPGIRLVGARIAGRLDLYGAVLSQTLWLDRCDIPDGILLANANTKEIRLRDCRLRRLRANRATIDGDLMLSGSTVLAGVQIDDAHITGVIRLNDATVAAPEKNTFEIADGPGDPHNDGPENSVSEWAIRAGGVTVDGGFFARYLMVDGGVRLLGARLRGGLHMEHTTIRATGTHAIQASHVETEIIELSNGFTAEGTIRLRSARVTGVLSFDRARLSAPGRVLHLSHAQINELILLPESIAGEVNLSYSHFGVLFDRPSAYPGVVRLNGTTYEQLRGRWELSERRAWVEPIRLEDYRPQPYERLAAWYRGIGNEPEARRVLLAKQRTHRRTLSVPGQVWGWLLDTVVGYGYRPWLAGLWAAVLLTIGTIVFQQHPPSQIPLDEERTFIPFVYTLDLLVPVSVFEQRGAWEPTGWTQWLAWGLIASGWILATALIAGATRVLRPTHANG